mmetsp:Transcript_64428/g.153715  ORF Transcript_64428/g.153715 Transcript_64428/m.153715 type:complete len:319 (+) Transcript_64428:94-1050(+)
MLPRTTDNQDDLQESPEAQSVLDKLLPMRQLASPTDGRTAPFEEQELEQLCISVQHIFSQQPMLLELDAPMTVLGDIHGQFFDLLRLMEFGGSPSENNYLFLGDYVDRGKNSIECIALLFAYKAKYPSNFFLLRGNHESSNINRLYGFYDEVKRRFSIKLWKTFCDAFSYMPISAMIEDRILCMHGGLSPELVNLDQIKQVRRPQADVGDSGLLCDLLWSDPHSDVQGWSENDRGVSFTFGTGIVENFCQKHDLDLICRAHQVVEDGYEFFAGRRLVTIFSAPHYCREFDNAGGLMSIDENMTCSFKVLKPLLRKRPA